MAKAKKSRKGLKIFLIVLASIILFCVVAGVIGYTASRARRTGGYEADPDERIALDESGSIGRVKITTLPLAENTTLSRCSYSFSGRVIVVTREGADTVITTMNDDGTDPLEVYRGSGAGTSRILPFKDNTRVLMGDNILEAPEGYTLDNCPADSGKLVPIEFPREFSSDSAVVQKWTEVIIAPDCEHFAWTIRRSDCGAVNAMGSLKRSGDKYIIENAQYISSMNGFILDPDVRGRLIAEPVIGGEVKQFIDGGRAISLVGSAPNGMADSVKQDIATGEVTLLSCAPGYDETTLLSPDERLGAVMTSRFSDKTDMGALGLVERPLGQPLHNILAQVYMYCVTGVRSGREGNVGPALVEMDRAVSDTEYKGVYLGDPDEKFIFRSPLSWNDTGTKLMWIEGKKSGGGVRVRIAELLDYTPGNITEAVLTPDVGDYATAPAKSMDFAGKLYGKASGYAELTRKIGFLSNISIRIVYHDYSDDGISFYNGTEESSGAIMTDADYKADITVTGADGSQKGRLEADVRFTAAYSIARLFGANAPELKSGSYARAEYLGKTRDFSHLVK